MKSVDFFLDKAKQYVSDIDDLTKNYIDYISAYHDPAKKEQYDTQKQSINSVQLKTQLLFAEFDKGDIFNEHIKSSEKSRNPFTQDTETLAIYKSVLETFIDHLNEFRK